MSGQFDNLLKDIEGLTADSEALAKALPADGEDDEKIQAAAADGDDKGDGGDAADGKGDDGKPMAKSFEVTLPDGTKAEATDGTELVKALGERMDATEGLMAKALTGAVTLIKSQSALIKQQGEMLKSLTDQVKKLGAEGRGRKATVVITEKQNDTQLAKSSNDSMTAEQFMLKANAAFDNSKLTGLELTAIDVALRSGQPVDPALISKVVSA